MEFSEFLQEIGKLQCHEKRTQTPNYVEVVVSEAHWETMDRVLESFFGAPLKPRGQNPSKEADRCAQPYGGIRRDQTLYFQRNETRAVYAALLWPWGNGTLTTLKIIASEGGGASQETQPVAGPLRRFIQKIFGV